MLKRTPDWPELIETNQRLVEGVQRKMGDVYPVAKRYAEDRYGRA